MTSNLLILAATNVLFPACSHHSKNITGISPDHNFSLPDWNPVDGLDVFEINLVIQPGRLNRFTSRCRFVEPCSQVMPGNLPGIHHGSATVGYCEFVGHQSIFQ